MQKEIQVLRPAGVELFYHSADKVNSLSLELANDPRLLEQAGMRRVLYNLLKRIFDQVSDPCISLYQATEKGLIDNSTVSGLWQGISNFLEQDENNTRILLYLPFELLPNLNLVSDELSSSAQRLAGLYRNGWIQLLHETEPRANFVDGDVLEPGLGQPARVSKVGHLSPELLSRGIIDVNDILMILEAVPDISSKSLAQGVMVANDRGLLVSEDWDRVQEVISKRFGSIGQLFTGANKFMDSESPIISPARAAWLRKVYKEEMESKRADMLAQQLVDELISVQAGEIGKVELMAVFIGGKKLLKQVPEKVGSFVLRHEATIKNAWAAKDSSLKNIITDGLNHWARLGIIDAGFLEELGIKLVDLSSPFPFEIQELEEDFTDLITASYKIGAHPYLSKILYPGFLVFGSRVKGYADFRADLDAAIFFRPGVDIKDRLEILKVFKNDISDTLNSDKFLEYWTAEKDGQLRFIRPVENTRIFVAEEEIHFSIGGSWIGNEELALLRHRMLERYLDLSRFGDQKKHVRRQLLGQLELDILQYRLMHKGYRKLYPLVEREDTENSGLIDFKSDFWDPGYRRVATQLFLSRVFLPDLS